MFRVFRFFNFSQVCRVNKFFRVWRLVCRVHKINIAACKLEGLNSIGLQSICNGQKGRLRVRSLGQSTDIFSRVLIFRRKRLHIILTFLGVSRCFSLQGKISIFHFLRAFFKILACRVCKIYLQGHLLAGIFFVFRVSIPNFKD